MLLSAISMIVLIAATVFVIEALMSADAERTHWYRLAFYAFIFLILLIKLRIRMGFRILRGALFHVHLSSAVLFFFSLAVLAFWVQPTWLTNSMSALFAVALATGTILFWRGTMQVLRE